MSTGEYGPAMAQGHTIRIAKWLEASWSSVREPILIFIATRISLWLVAYFAVALLPLAEWPGSWRAFPDNFFLDGWVRWDSGWYLKIVTEGYSFKALSQQSSVAFFPMYPLTVKALSLVIGDAAVAAIVAANLAFLAALILLYRLLVEQFPDVNPRRVLLLVTLFPFAFFYTAAYSESLFLLTVVGAFYFGHKRRWLIAALFAMAASATRLVGVVAGGALLLLYFEQIDYRPLRIRPNIAWLALAPLGVAFFLVYLYVRFGDPLLYFHAHDAWGQQASLSFIPHRDYIYALLHADFARAQLPLIDILNFLTGTAFLIGSVIAFRFLRPPYALLCLGLTLLPYCMTHIPSLGRYIMVAFPLFILAARWLRGELSYTLAIALCAPLLGLLTVLFVLWVPVT